LATRASPRIKGVKRLNPRVTAPVKVKRALENRWIMDVGRERAPLKHGLQNRSTEGGGKSKRTGGRDCRSVVSDEAERCPQENWNSAQKRYLRAEKREAGSWRESASEGGISAVKNKGKKRLQVGSESLRSK